MKNDVSKESETYMYLAGGKRWVENNFSLVFFKHHYLNRFLHKVTYVKEIHKPTKMYKEKAPNQGKPYINIQIERYINLLAGLLEVRRQQARFGSLQAPLSQYISA